MTKEELKEICFYLDIPMRGKTWTSMEALNIILKCAFINDNIRRISLQSIIECIPLSCMEVGKNMSVMGRDMSN